MNKLEKPGVSSILVGLDPSYLIPPKEDPKLISSIAVILPVLPPPFLAKRTLSIALLEID